MDRRNFLKAGIIGGASGIISGSAQAEPLSKLSPTPKEIKGPFYPVIAQKDKDFDLTQIEGKKEVAQGIVVVIEGKVLDLEGNPIEDATVDLWQANAAGRYRHPHDSTEAPLDPNFQGWAIVPSGKEGKFRFKTIYPGSYSVSKTWNRPPHIHFKVTKRGYIDLITQMYFQNDELNKVDRLLQRKSKEERELMIAVKVKDKPATYNYNIILEKV